MLYKPYIPYPGGKFFMLKHLLKLIPPHICYVEVFGGGAKFLLNKPPSKNEVYNDIDDSIYNLFYVLADKKLYKKFKEKLKWTIASRKEFYRLVKLEKITNDAVEKAYCTYYLLNMSFANLKDYYGYSSQSLPKQFRNAIEYRLNLIHDRIKYVNIENDSFEKIIKRYDSKDTFFYLDPPYIHKARITKKIYANEMTDEQHIQMLNIVNKSKGKFLISGYNSEIYNKYLKDWNKEIYKNRCLLINNKYKYKNRERNDIVWYNYEKPTQN